MLTRRICNFLTGLALLTTGSAYGSNDLLMYDLEDLSQLVVEENTATLTPSSTRETPASVTVITHEQIAASGARSLDELLEIFVPSFAIMYKVHGTQMGMRGIISDRNNKILLLVNGRNMNVKATDGGAVTERWTSALDDIAKVTVISGPGSAVFGPGAIAGVISIETFNGMNYEGTDVHLRAGAGTSFLSAQLRHGRKLENGTGLFLYYGVEQASGADDDRAPHKLAFDLTIERPAYGTVTTIQANENFPFATTPDGASYLAKPRHKLHLQLDGDNFSVWARYTQSGQAMPTLQNLYHFPYYEYGQNYPDIFQNTGNEQKQWTLYGRYTQTVDPTLYIDYSASYMRTAVDIRTLDTDNSGKKWNEKDLIVDAVAHYTPGMRHAFALGVSYDYTDFTNERKLLATLDPPTAATTPLADHPSWYSDMVSVYGEYQGKFGDETTLFAGMRLDKHRFSPWMVSPRLALVYMPNPTDTYKLVYNHSVRHSDDADLFSIYLQTGQNGDVEKIDHLEGIVMHRFDARSEVELSLYFNHHNVVAYTQSSAQQQYIGTLRFYGVEAQYRYSTEVFSFFLSHSYTKEISFDLADPAIAYQNISASPYGYGDDLANWNDHITKLRLQWNPSARLQLNGSLRVYWGLPGAKDMADYNMDQLGGSLLLPLYSDGTRVFGPSAFLDLGVQYRLTPRTRLSLYGYDLLGLFDDDLNKRNFFQRSSQYRDTAPSLAVGLRYQF